MIIDYPKDMKLIIANWKANKDIKEAEDWVSGFLELYNKKKLREAVKLIIAPSHPSLKTVRDLLPPEISVASQDISFYGRGSYTGEVPASTLVGLVEYSIIGHSERRKYFNETNNIVDQKAILALDNEIEPIVCIRGKEDLIPKKVKVVAYEPEEAIGTGNNASIASVLDMKKSLALDDGVKFLYGGSVDENSIEEYLKSPEIDGFLVGGASNDPHTFYNMASKL